MIFVCLGSQKFQFNRVLKEIDTLRANGAVTEDIFAQIGYSDYLPANYKTINFLDQESYAKHMSEASIVITHGGTGAIIGAVKAGKKVIAIPRSKTYGEHVDDHQFQIVKQFEEMNIIAACYEMSQLGVLLNEIHTKEFMPYASNTETIVKDLVTYLERAICK